MALIRNLAKACATALLVHVLSTQTAAAIAETKRGFDAATPADIALVAKTMPVVASNAERILTRRMSIGDLSHLVVRVEGGECQKGDCPTLFFSNPDGDAKLIGVGFLPDTMNFGDQIHLLFAGGPLGLAATFHHSNGDFTIIGLGKDVLIIPNNVREMFAGAGAQ